MKPFIEKLTLEEDHSFVARTFRTPQFEVPWHQHPEFEIILFLEGEGNAFVGNHVGNFSKGDIYFLGSNLPHTFQKSHPELITSAVVVQFLDDCWGNGLLNIPEAREIRTIMEKAGRGLKISSPCLSIISPIIQQLETSRGFERIILLWQCLREMALDHSHESLSTKKMSEASGKQQERIDKIFQYTIDHYAEGITLDEISAYAGLSVPAFCQYFRKCTKKTYIEFLNEVRIGKACQQLIDTSKPITEIAYECGYNTLANFNKQFLKLKVMQPREFRSKFSESRKLLETNNAATAHKQLTSG